MNRVLIIIPTTSYRAHDFMMAARRLDIEVIIGSEHRQALSKLLPDSSLALNLRKPESSIETIKELAKRKPLSAIIGVDEETVVLASMANEALGLPGNSSASAKATRNKYLMRQRMSEAGLLNPKFHAFPIDSNPKKIGAEIEYPSVLKPTFLSASQGVIRVNSQDEFPPTWERLLKILASPSVKKKNVEADQQILVENYIPGTEVAVEGMLMDGEFKLLAIFDKPDPMEGPYFIETIYVTPSRYPQNIQKEIIQTTTGAARALGLTTGPVHSEMRINDGGIWMLEIAARSIGGICARALRFDDEMSLEELILRHTIGEDIHQIEREENAAGVMMMPVLKSGILEEVKNVEKAKQISGIEEIVISIATEQKIEPLPFGSKYLGFIFARGYSPESVENSIRQAYAKLEVVVQCL